MVNPSLNNSSSFHNSHPTPAQTTPRQPGLTLAMQKALEAIRELNLTIEICGSWVWVSGSNTSQATALKAANFKWSSKKRAWYLCPGNSKRRFYHQSWSMEKIRETHGSQAIPV